MNDHRDYSDIIDLPCHEPSARHPRMSTAERNAQFAAVTMVDIPDLAPGYAPDYVGWGDWYADQTGAWCE